MKPNKQLFVPRVRDGERGQAIVMVPLLLGLLLAMAALVLDLGNLYFAYQEIQSATQAAALAGGEAIVSQSLNAQAVAYQYSGDPNAPVTGGTVIYNQHPNLTYTYLNAQMGCINPATYPTYGLPPCATYGANIGNSIQVTEKATVNTFFAGIFGFPTLPVAATATASATGGGAGSWNIAIIIDTTPSMSTKDTTCGIAGSPTRLQCAEDGIQTLLKAIVPCTPGLTCTSSTATDRVALFAFPNITVATAPDDYTCRPQTAPTPVVTAFPTAGAPSYSPSDPTGTYQITGFFNDYQGSKPATPPTLSAQSWIVEAAGAGSCAGMGVPVPSGGWNGANNVTYYAGAIYAAQSALVNEQSLNPGSANAMILLSDGDAANSTSWMASGYSTTTGTYPSSVDQCGQAVTAAQNAMAAGTRVYSVAYGSAATGCSTDKSGFSSGITPCGTMEGIAGGATSTYFYSDYNQSGTVSTCQSASQHVTTLHDIFLAIGESLTGSRLVPPTVASGFTP